MNQSTYQDLYGSQIQSFKPLIDRATSVDCPLCKQGACEGQFCEGKGWVWMAPTGALFPPSVKNSAERPT